MYNLSSMKLRGLVGVIALAGCAALAMPSAQAAPAGATDGLPIPVPGAAAKPSDSGRRSIEATSGWTASSSYNAVRYAKLYSTPYVPASGCKRPNVALNTEARVRYFETELVRCLYAAWNPIVWRAGGRYNVKPAVVVHGYTTINTSCGKVTGPTSFYCSTGSGTIYIPWRQIVTYYGQDPTFGVAYATNTIAHEYGHHVQSMTSILTASWWRQQHMTGDAALAESRRRELQASCLGSAYIGANKVAYPMSGGLLTQWKYVVSHSGDQAGQPRDHGSWTNHNFWSLAGFNGDGHGTHAGSCQTWAAAATRIA
jgi:hypothetical protein